MSSLYSKRLIFHNERTEELACIWKRDRSFAALHRICDHLTNLMTSIIKRQRYHMTVPFADLMSHLYAQIDRWVDKWKPGQGKFYTYACSSIKHGCLSCIVRENVFHQRHQAVGDVPLDVLGGFTDSRDSHGLSEVVAAELAEIHVRWHEPELREACRVILDTLMRHRGESRQRDLEGRSVDVRRGLLATLRLGYDIPPDQARFLIDWTRGAMRIALLDHFKSPLTKSDVIRLSGRFSFLPDLVEVVGVESASRLLHVFAGVSLRFPTMSQMLKHRKACDQFNDLVEGREVDVDSQALEELVQQVGSGILEDRPLLEQDDVERLAARVA